MKGKASRHIGSEYVHASEFVSPPCSEKRMHEAGRCPHVGSKGVRGSRKKMHVSSSSKGRQRRGGHCKGRQKQQQ